MKAILLDVDGTLANNINALYDIYHDFLSFHVCHSSTEEFNHLIGASLHEITAYLKDKHNIKEDLEVLYQQYHEMLQREYVRKAPLFPGVKTFITQMHKKGLRLGIVSGAIRSLIDSFLDAHKLTDYIEMITSGDDVERGKPDPTIYRQALAHLALPAKDVIAIEDSLNGVRATIGANIPTLLITHSDPTLSQEVQSWNTDLVTPVNDWAEIKTIIQTMLRNKK